MSENGPEKKATGGKFATGPSMVKLYYKNVHTVFISSTVTFNNLWIPYLDTSLPPVNMIEEIISNYFVYQK